MFKNRLKTLRKEKGYSQKELAKILGVGQTTIANYEKGIREPNQKMLKVIATTLSTTIDYLLDTKSNILQFEPEIDTVFLRKAFLALLLDGKSEEAISLLENNVQTKKSAISVIEEVIVPTQYDVGELWYNGVIDVGREHYITGIAMKLIGRISKYLDGPVVNDDSALCLTSYNESHTLGLQIIAEYLKSFGYKTFFLGGNVPIDSLHQMINDTKPSLIAISITMPDHTKEMNQLIEAIRDKHKHDFHIIVGGQGQSELEKVTESDGYASDYNSLKLLMTSLLGEADAV